MVQMVLDRLCAAAQWCVCTTRLDVEGGCSPPNPEHGERVSHVQNCRQPYHTNPAPPQPACDGAACRDGRNHARQTAQTPLRLPCIKPIAFPAPWILWRASVEAVNNAAYDAIIAAFDNAEALCGDLRKAAA